MAPKAAAQDAEELRRRKRNKLIIYIVLFVISHIGGALVMSLTVMKVRTPKFHVRTAVITNIAAANSSFSATMIADLAVRNNNFGRYKYENTTVEFMHGGASAGRAVVRSSRANMRSTKKFEVTVDLRVAASSRLASDLSDGVVRLSGNGKMMGKVELFMVMKKKRSTAMNCSMEIVIATQQIMNIVCK